MHDSTYAPSGSEILVARDTALDCLAWTTAIETESGDDAAGYLDSVDNDWHDSARAAMERIISDFISENSVDLHGLSYSDIGHNFVLSANRHGAGFWDMGLADRGDRLHDMAAAHDEFYAYIGDDDFIYLAEIQGE